MTSTTTPPPDRQSRRRVDDRWRLKPRDYAETPELFGTGAPIAFHTPAGGSLEEMQRAQLLHRIFGAVKRNNPQLSGAQLGRANGFSRSLWSACKAGKQWPPSTLLQAALLHIQQPPGNA